MKSAGDAKPANNASLDQTVPQRFYATAENLERRRLGGGQGVSYYFCMLTGLSTLIPLFCVASAWFLSLGHRSLARINNLPRLATSSSILDQRPCLNSACLVLISIIEPTHNTSHITVGGNTHAKLPQLASQHPITLQHQTLVRSHLQVIFSHFQAEAL